MGSLGKHCLALRSPSSPVGCEPRVLSSPGCLLGVPTGPRAACSPVCHPWGPSAGCRSRAQPWCFAALLPAPREFFLFLPKQTRAEPARCGRRRRWSPYGTELNTTAARRSLQVLKVNGAARACGDEGRAQRGALGLRGVRDVNGSTGKHSCEGLGLATGPLGISEISE